MGRKALSKQEKALATSLNSGLKCPNGLEALDGTELVECDICHRIVLYWHFHTIALSGDDDGANSVPGAGLDCCNVCRFRYDQAVAKSSAKEVSIAAVHQNGRKRTLRMSTQLRFYFVGPVSPDTSQVVGKDRLAFFKRMLSHEKDPSVVHSDDLFLYNKDSCPLTIQVAEEPAKTKTKSKTTKTTREEKIVDEVPVTKKTRAEKPCSKSSSEGLEKEEELAADDDNIKVAVKKTPRAEAAENTETELKSPATLVAVAKAIKKSKNKATEDDANLAVIGETPLLTASPAEIPVVVAAHAAPSPLIDAPTDLAGDHYPQSTLLPVPTSASMPLPAAFAEEPTLIPTITSLPPATAVLVANKSPKKSPAVKAAERKAKRSREIPDVCEDGPLKGQAEEEQINTVEVPPEVCQAASLEPIAAGACDVSQTTPIVTSVANFVATSPTTTSAPSPSKDLMDFFASLPTSDTLPQSSESSDATTFFTLHSNGGNLPPPSLFEVPCAADQSIALLKDENAILGLRVSGSRMVEAAWVPTPDAVQQVEKEAFFSVASLDDPAHTMLINKVLLDTSGRAERIVPLYKVALGKKVPIGVEWIPIPGLFDRDRNRIGACTLVRDTDVCTFLLPINIESSVEEEAEAEENGEMFSITPNIAGHSTLPSSIQVARWVPSIDRLEDLRLIVQLKNSSIHILRAMGEEDAPLSQATQNIGCPMRLVTEAVIHPPPPSTAYLGGLSSIHVGLIGARLHVAWANGGELCMGRLPYTSEEGVARKNINTHATAMAFADNGLVYASQLGAVRLWKGDAKDAAPIAEPIGVDVSFISTVTVKGVASSKQLLMGTITNQLCSLRRTSMTTMHSLMEFICTPKEDGDEVMATNADLCTSFDVMHQRNDHTNTNNLLSRLVPLRGFAADSYVPADVQWRVAQRSSTASSPFLVLGMCPDGSTIVFTCDAQ